LWVSCDICFHKIFGFISSRSSYATGNKACAQCRTEAITIFVRLQQQHQQLS